MSVQHFNKRQKFHYLLTLIGLSLVTPSYAVTEVPVEVFVRNVDWPNNLVVQIYATHSGAGTIQEVLPIPPYTLPYTFSVPIGQVYGNDRVFYMRNLGTPYLEGTLQFSFNAVVSGLPASQIQVTHNLSIAYNAIQTFTFFDHSADNSNLCITDVTTDGSTQFPRITINCQK